MIGSNNKISVKRMVEASSKETFDSSYVYTSEPCYIEPMDAQVATIIDDQNAFYMVKIFLEGQLDIRIGDKCVDLQSKEYIVKGVEPFSNNTDTGDMTQLVAVRVFP